MKYFIKKNKSDHGFVRLSRINNVWSNHKDLIWVDKLSIMRFNLIKLKLKQTNISIIPYI